MLLEKRMAEFVHYHIHGDGECNGVTLKKYADSHDLTKEKRIDLAYLFAVTYCIESSIVMLREINIILRDVDGWIAKNKHKLIFQSDRKYVRMRDSFNKCMRFYRDNTGRLRNIKEDDVIDLKKWIPEVETYPMFGRFSAYLYLETIAWLLGSKIINADMDWENGATATSGLLNVYCYDEEANLFDKERKLRKPFTPQVMQEMVEPILYEIKMQGGDDNITMVETSLCAYRKFFKGSRYNGYYLDRMLEEILKMQKDYPAESKELFEIRRTCFDEKYLGEIGGWKGIRKECKKLYKDHGIIM